MKGASRSRSSSRATPRSPRRPATRALAVRSRGAARGAQPLLRSSPAPHSCTRRRSLWSWSRPTSRSTPAASEMSSSGSRFTARAATPRPWLADSALERAAPRPRTAFEFVPRKAVLSGLEFQEVVSVTRLHSGIADNVIRRSRCNANLRYPPDREPVEAEEFLTGLVPEGATLEVLSNARRHGRRLPCRPRAATRGRPRDRPQTGVDERRRLHDARARRGELRPGHTAFAHTRRSG